MRAQELWVEAESLIVSEPVVRELPEDQRAVLVLALSLFLLIKGVS